MLRTFEKIYNVLLRPDGPYGCSSICPHLTTGLCKNSFLVFTHPRKFCLGGCFKKKTKFFS